MQQEVATGASVPVLPEECIWLDGGQSYVVCAFYTPNYLEQVTSLKASLDKLGINYFLKRYERRATWEATTRLKPVFLDHVLTRLPTHNVVYVDADAVVRQPLVFFDETKADVSLLIHEAHARGRRYLRLASGTVFVRNSEGGRKFARVWKSQEERSSALTLDEDMIYMSFSDLQGVTFAVLPTAYCKIFDRPGEPGVIEHYQASRGQFKWLKVIRRVKRYALIALAAAVVALAVMGLRRVLG